MNGLAVKASELNDYEEILKSAENTANMVEEIMSYVATMVISVDRMVVKSESLKNNGYCQRLREQHAKENRE